MKKKRIGKVLALFGILALCLLLSGCYVPPDEITDNTENLTVGSNNLPFQTLAPATDTAAPTATPTPYAGTQGGDTGTSTSGSQPTINWNDDWGGTSTTNAGSTATATPSNSSIVVVTPTPKPASTTSSSSSATATPATTTLKKGSTGSDVRTMQQRLKELGYLTGSADGDFGTATEEAVKAFQKANGLTVDGKAGTKTLQKLYSDSAVKASSSSSSSSSSATATPKKTATPTPKKTATPTPKKTATPTPKPTATPDLSKATYLQSGSSGKKVKQLQQRLIELGWLDGTADGEYGGATEAAVKAFQKKMGLWSDGIAGPDTQAKLYSSSASKSSSPVASIGETLEEGMNGDAVRALQKKLKSLGYYTGTVDGDYGSGTVEAVKAFQSANGLTVDGKAGTKTLNAIYGSSASSSSGSSSSDSSSSSSDGTSSTGYTTLEEGDESSAVKKLQQALKNLGYYTGSVDGKYGSGTTDAVRDFQKVNNLTVDGKAGPATQRVLYGNNASANTTYSTLREYDEGTSVKKMQYALYELGYYDGKVDGVYGETTKDAVRAFQSNNGLSPVDGIAGNKTLQKLYSSSAKSATAPNTTYTTLRKGDKGDDVVQLQDVLVQKGYLSTVTGVYDDATVTAVKNYQKNNNLSVDGSAGSETLTKLYGN